MVPHQMHQSATHSRERRLLNRLLGVMSIVTMVMTVPQVWIIWVDRQTAGASLLSWSAYLASALLWLWHGLREHDRNIYLACVGWILLDLAVVVGIIVYR